MSPAPSMLRLGSPRLCIVLPVLNEAMNITPLLERIHASVGSISTVVCIIDDGSIDDTVALAAGTADRVGLSIHIIQRVKTHAGSQRGSALFAGMVWGLENTAATVFAEMDGDLSHRPEEIPVGFDLIDHERCDVAIASKYVPGSATIDRPIGRRWISRTCNLLVRGVISPRIRDYSNGYRFYSRSAASAIAQTRIRYGSPIYLTEAVSIWLSKGFRTSEFTTTYVGRGQGESKLRMIDLAKAAVGIFEIALRLHVLGFAKTREHSRATRPVAVR